LIYKLRGGERPVRVRPRAVAEHADVELAPVNELLDEGILPEPLLSQFTCRRKPARSATTLSSVIRPIRLVLPASRPEGTKAPALPEGSRV